MTRRINLLKKAQAIKTSKAPTIPTNELIVVSLAWLQGNVSLTQINQALYGTSRKNINGAYPKLAVALKEAFSRGILTIK